MAPPKNTCTFLAYERASGTQLEWCAAPKPDYTVVPYWQFLNEAKGPACIESHLGYLCHNDPSQLSKMWPKHQEEKEREMKEMKEREMEKERSNRKFPL